MKINEKIRGAAVFCAVLTLFSSQAFAKKKTSTVVGAVPKTAVMPETQKTTKKTAQKTEKKEAEEKTDEKKKSAKSENTEKKASKKTASSEKAVVPEGGAAGTKVEYKINPDSKKTVEKNSSNDLVNPEGVFTSKTVKNTVGRIKMLAKGSVGSIQFYVKNEEEKFIPVFAGYDEFTSSFFSMSAGKKLYKLTNDSEIVIGARKSDKGVQMVYAVPNQARLIAKYECLQSSLETEEDIVKVTLVLKNKGKKTDIFGLKQVVDTYLGEQSQPHFASADNSLINNETQYRKFDKMKYITSGNKKAAVQFLFDGADISRPEAVTLSNKDSLSVMSWYPVVTNGKTFDSVISYNNSALGINWEQVRLAPQEEVEFVYYMALSADGYEPQGKKFIEELDKKLHPEEEKAETAVEQKAAKPVEKAVSKPAPKVEEKKPESEAVKQEEVYIPEPVVTPAYVKPAVPETPSAEPEVQSVKIQPDELREEQLNPDYIQKLLDRINDLEKDDESVDRKELILLNAELDAILLKLGSQ